MLQFRIQSTPNPQARKYIVSRDLKTSGKVSYQQADQCAHVPLAASLLRLPGVTQVHFFENCLTVTQDGSLDWQELDYQVQSLVADGIEGHDPDFVDVIDAQPKATHDNPDLARIDAILDRQIRPALQMDGGDIEPIDLENHILTIRYLGACGGCPSALGATMEAVVGVLREEFDEQLEVVAI